MERSDIKSIQSIDIVGCSLNVNYSVLTVLTVPDQDNLYNGIGSTRYSCSELPYSWIFCQWSLQASHLADHELMKLTTGQEKLLGFAARPKVAKEARKAPSTSHINKVCKLNGRFLQDQRIKGSESKGLCTHRSGMAVSRFVNLVTSHKPTMRKSIKQSSSETAASCCLYNLYNSLVSV